ncbi:hypothetical protein OUZ56_009458 [Daphnia magna]|uniref:Uncharacterized protein n=1 Tax=Daphnia magna TaxID=35525 RepID=A0ABR0AG75_9CRUS|nr:hypothetical protein OUZ56_009458 [Daphnia magna]
MPTVAFDFRLGRDSHTGAWESQPELLTTAPPVADMKTGKPRSVWYGPGKPPLHSPLSHECVQPPPLDHPSGRLELRVASAPLSSKLKKSSSRLIL